MGQIRFLCVGLKACPPPSLSPRDCQHHLTQHLQTPNSACATTGGEARSEDATHSLQLLIAEICTAGTDQTLRTHCHQSSQPGQELGKKSCPVSGIDCGTPGLCVSILLSFHLETPPTSPSQIKQPHGKAVSKQNLGRTKTSVPRG